MTSARRIAAFGALVALAAACSPDDRLASDVGGDLFRDPDLSPSSFNTFSCATCHQTGATPDPNRIDPGYSLHGVTARQAFWGGHDLQLFDSVSFCIEYFMRGDPLDETGDESRQLYEYLVSISPDGSDPSVLPMTVVENIAPIAPGDAARGAVVYDQACRRCHGEAHAGDGSILAPQSVVLPEYTDQYDDIFPGVPHGLVVIEKIRHGSFFNVGGVMPLYSTEALSDGQIGDLLAFLGLESGA